MTASTAVLEQWLARAVEVYGEQIAPLAAAERDPFRNPIGTTLRRHLEVLLEQLLGPMDAAVVDASMEQIIAVRAIQDLSASAAVGFVFALRDILRHELPEQWGRETEGRIDRLALAAFEHYVRRREQLAQLRLQEQVRALGPLPYRLRQVGGSPERGRQE